MVWTNKAGGGKGRRREIETEEGEGGEIKARGRRKPSMMFRWSMIEHINCGMDK